MKIILDDKIFFLKGSTRLRRKPVRFLQAGDAQAVGVQVAAVQPGGVQAEAAQPGVRQGAYPGKSLVKKGL